MDCSYVSIPYRFNESFYIPCDIEVTFQFQFLIGSMKAALWVQEI